MIDDIAHLSIRHNTAKYILEKHRGSLPYPRTEVLSGLTSRVRQLPNNRPAEASSTTGAYHLPLHTRTHTLAFHTISRTMSGCIGCANQPGDNGSLGGAGHEGTVTPMVIGIIIGTVAIFILVVCALFYCVKLENNKYMAKIGDSPPCGGGGSGDGGDSGESSESVKSRPSSVTIVPASVRVVGGATVGVREVGASVGYAAGGGGGGSARGEGKRRLFAWGRKSGESWWSILVS